MCSSYVLTDVIKVVKMSTIPFLIQLENWMVNADKLTMLTVTRFLCH